MMRTVEQVAPSCTHVRAAAWRAAVLAGAVGVILAGCTAVEVPTGAARGLEEASKVNSGTPPAPGPITTPPASTRSPTSSAASAPEHIVVVIFENKDAGQVDGAGSAPSLNGLAAEGTVFTDAHGEAHPSQPNYVALFSGSTHGVDGDSCPQNLTGQNLASQLIAAGRTFVGYSEDLPTPGYTGCGDGSYARKHNPWADFPELPASVNQPLTALPTDFASLPTVAMIVPNLCHDMHDCSVATGDEWFRRHLAGYARWAQTHESMLIVTVDESDGSDSSNHIPTFVVGQRVLPGVSHQRIDHYTLLRTIEDFYGLAPLGQARDAQSLTGIWRRQP
jgi:acid phosphatase